jgi:uncharacterized membrane protein YeiH
LTLAGWKQLDLDGWVKEDGPALWATDTLGIGAFCCIGAQNAIRMGLHPIICVICGMITSTGGGIVRDVVCNHPVRILHSKAEVYATTAIAGSTTYIAARAMGAPPAVRIATAMLVAMTFRGAATKFVIKLPQAPWVAHAAVDTHEVPHRARKLPPPPALT